MVVNCDHWSQMRDFMRTVYQSCIQIAIAFNGLNSIITFRNKIQHRELHNLCARCNNTLSPKCYLFYKNVETGTSLKNTKLNTNCTM